MKRIYFVRHGESEHNKLGLASGSEVDTPLTKNGRQQAKKTGKLLKSKNIELVVSSPMIRALETARIISREIGYDPGLIQTDADFIERGFGIYSEKPDAEYIAAIYSDKPLHKSVEEVSVMNERVVRAIEKLKKEKAKNILIVSHGGVSRIIRLIHQDLPYTHMYKLDRLPNAEIYEFDL